MTTEDTERVYYSAAELEGWKVAFTNLWMQIRPLEERAHCGDKLRIMAAIQDVLGDINEQLAIWDWAANAQGVDQSTWQLYTTYDLQTIHGFYVSDVRDYFDCYRYQDAPPLDTSGGGEVTSSGGGNRARPESGWGWILPLGLVAGAYFLYRKVSWPKPKKAKAKTTLPAPTIKDLGGGYYLNLKDNKKYMYDDAWDKSKNR